MKPHYRPMTMDDVRYLAPRLRPEDEAEVIATGSNPMKALTDGYYLSAPVYTMVGADGIPFGAFGVVPISDDGAAAVWLLATPGIEKQKMSFARQSIEVTKRLNRQYPVLTNVVDARNELHIKWLKWLGFQAIQVHPRLGPMGLPFYEFVRINPDV